MPLLHVIFEFIPKFVIDRGARIRDPNANNIMNESMIKNKLG
jgi:hypothetical protein